MGIDTDDDKDLIAMTSSTGEDDERILSEKPKSAKYVTQDNLN